MAWTTPMTFSSGAVLTAAQLNTHLRDNLNETAPAKATTAGRIFVTDGVNSIAQRIINGTRTLTSETTASTSFTDLATVGPQVASIGTGIRALVFLAAEMSNSSASGATLMSYDVSGSTTIAASADRSLRTDDVNTGVVQRVGATFFHADLTAGTQTFTAKYSVGSGGTGTFRRREIIVIAL